MKMNDERRTANGDFSEASCTLILHSSFFDQTEQSEVAL